MVTVEEILKLKQELTRYYQPALSKFKDMANLYNLDITVATPSGFDAHIPPTSRAVVDKATDNLITLHPEVSVERRAETEAAQKQADALERFYKRILFKMDRRLPMPLFRASGKNLFIYGMAVIKGPLFDTASWPDKPEQGEDETSADYEERLEVWEAIRKDACPIYIIPVDPQIILLDPNLDNPKFVIETFKRKAIQIRTKWPNWEGRKPKGGVYNDFDEVDWTEYWSQTERCYIAGSEPVLGPIPNVYGFVPYAPCFSGFGKVSPEGKLEELAVGLLAPIESSLKAEARIKTALDADTQLRTFTRWRTDMDPHKLELDIGPGGISYIPTGIQFDEMPQGQLSPDHYKYLGMIIADIENSSFPRWLGRTESGFQESIRLGESRRMFSGPVTALEMAGALTLSRAAMLAEHVIGEEVEGLKPSMVKGYYRCKLSLETADPEGAVKTSLHGLELFRAGAIDLLYFLENYARVPDAAARIKRMMVERILNHPLINQAVALRAAQEWGMDLSAIMGTQPQERRPGSVPAVGLPGETERQHLAEEAFGGQGGVEEMLRRVAQGAVR